MPARATPDRILVVDDAPDLRHRVTRAFRAAGFAVDAVGSGQAGLALARKTRPAVVVLDLVLSDGSGADVCRQLRADPVLGDLGVLLLTALGEERDRLAGFEAGADDYVVKPFSLLELVLRVKALARRIAGRRAERAASARHEKLRWRGVELDPVAGRAVADGRDLALRPLELKLLRALVEHPGRVFSRPELLERVWGVRGEGTSRTVDTHVRRLRVRLGARAADLETVHGFGYRAREEG